MCVRIIMPFIILFTLFACKNKTHFKSDFKKSGINSDSLHQKYSNILEGLGNGYVLYYTQLKSTNTDLKLFGLSEKDSVFASDSLKYADSYLQFFQQDISFLFWLLSFKRDTLHNGLWQESHNPISSRITACHFIMDNSKAALNLIQSFLDGRIIRCHECEGSSDDCTEVKYQQIEYFLLANREKSVPELRKEWNKKL